ncbi:MAG: methionyl-tRNA formyltransferase [Bacteroidales bacterium]|nr:methionyl-tRNA formyltransferase [Bacteroidales bacterium]
MGTPEFAVASLDAICHSSHEVVGVVTVPDKQSGRGLKMNCSAVKEYAMQHSLPLLQPEKLRDPSFLSALETLNADIFVVVAFRMLPECVWAMPPRGTFNLHASLLPQYRGAAPINWAIINGERQTGVTTFMLNERIDEGKILLQESCEIDPEDTAETVHDRLAEMGRRIVIRTLDGIADNQLHPTQQPEVNHLRTAPKIYKADCAIPWHKCGHDIENFVRGLSPYPAATMHIIDATGKELLFKVFKVEHQPAENSSIGSIVSDGIRVLKVGVSDGFIHILSLQLSGKHRVSIDEFLRGHNTNHWKLIP